MSKVVSGIGNAIGGVVKGVVNVVKGVVKGVGDLAKSIASSKLGKAIIIAGAIYFGGAALAGGFGSSAAGGSFLSGMGAGVSSAASTLSGAWSSVMAGNFSQAAGAVGNAWGTAGAAAGQAAGATAAQAAGTGAMTVSPTATPTAVTAPTVGAPTAVANGGVQTQAQMLAAQNAGIPGADTLTSAALKTGVTPPPAAPGFFSSDLAKYGAITAGTQVVGGMIQGAGQKQAQEDQRDYELRMAQEARDRYNANVGTALWGSNQPVNPVTGMPGVNAWDPQQAARDINARYSGQPMVATVGSPGVINRNISTVQPGTPMANNNYPVYNPYYATPPGRG
jgi:hypothetical protein